MQKQDVYDLVGCILACTRTAHHARLRSVVSPSLPGLTACYAVAEAVTIPTRSVIGIGHSQQHRVNTWAATSPCIWYLLPARRYYTINGKRADEQDVDRMIETGESETLFQKAILEQGRGRVGQRGLVVGAVASGHCPCVWLGMGIGLLCLGLRDGEGGECGARLCMAVNTARVWALRWACTRCSGAGEGDISRRRCVGLLCWLCCVCGVGLLCCVGQLRCVDSRIQHEAAWM